MLKLSKPLILASASPRRRELLSLLGVEYRVCVADVSEDIAAVSPEKIVQELAYRKASSVLQQQKNAIVIGADTIVSIDGVVLGKPKNEAEAIQMLQQLSGRTHEVYTGVSIVVENQNRTFFEKTNVCFYSLTPDMIQAYVKTKEPMDKAGAYGIQGKGAVLVKEIIGDYYTVVGLPIARLYRELSAMFCQE